MSTEKNWSDTHDFVAGRIHRPATIDAVRRIVAGTSRIHAVGARHSFNGAADSPGEIVDLGAIQPDIAIDPERRIATVGAGTDYAVLGQHLHEAGWALHNMASLPHVTVGGAVATGTHGSGDRLGTLSSAVATLELITATGDLLTLRRGDSGFDGAVVALGALGIVTRVGLDIQPAYAMRQDAYEALPWETLTGDFDAVMGAGTSVSIFTQWSTPTAGRLWIKTRLPDGDPGQQPAPPAGTHPAAHPSTAGTAESLLRLTGFGTPGPWWERLPHMRREFVPHPPEQIQSEYMLPRIQAVAAIGRMRAMGERIDRHLIVTEIRSMTADTLWLSPAHGHDTVAMHFTWKKDTQEVATLTQDIENALLPLGARPHWGKLIHAPAARLAPLYPRMDDFRQLVQRLDPQGKFRNAFLERHVLG